MQPLFQHIYLQSQESYNILFVDRPHFVVPWHFHPELEIMLVLNGEGSRIVGDSIEHYERGDLVLVGANLPHCWKSGEVHFQNEQNNAFRSKAFVILFREDSFGRGFFDLPEFAAIKQLFKRTARGIKFDGETKRRVIEKIKEAYQLKGTKRFALFMEILDDLATSTEFVLLSSENFEPQKAGNDMQRINTVLDYLMKNFKKPVKLEEVASLAFMSPTSFCRYFKARTNKSFSRFLNELRIGHAKKLLLTTEKNIDEISLDSGFSNLPNFYDQFKKITRSTPGEYKKERSNMII